MFSFKLHTITIREVGMCPFFQMKNLPEFKWVMKGILMNLNLIR